MHHLANIHELDQPTNDITTQYSASHYSERGAQNGERHIVGNCRPISILNTFKKILEKACRSSSVGQTLGYGVHCLQPAGHYNRI